MKMLPVEYRHGGKQNREATEHGHKTRIDRCDHGAVSVREPDREEEDTGRAVRVKNFETLGEII